MGQEVVHLPLPGQQRPHAVPTPPAPSAPQHADLLGNGKELGEVRERLDRTSPKRRPRVRPVFRVQLLDAGRGEEALPLDDHQGAGPQMLGQHALPLLVYRGLPDELHDDHEAPRLGDAHELPHGVAGITVVGEADLADRDVEDRIPVGQGVRASLLELQPTRQPQLAGRRLRLLHHTRVELDARREHAALPREVLEGDALAAGDAQDFLALAELREHRDVAKQLDAARGKEAAGAEPDQIEHGRDWRHVQR